LAITAPSITPELALPWQTNATRLIEAGWKVSVVTFPRDDLGYRYVVAAQKEGERLVSQAESLAAGFAQLVERIFGKAEEK
jgi:hypothetical protein